MKNIFLDRKMSRECRHCEEAKPTKQSILACARNDDRRRGRIALNLTTRRPGESRDPYSLNHQFEEDAGAIYSPSPRRSVVMGPGFRRDDIECLAIGARHSQVVMAGIAVRRTASLPFTYDPAIHDLPLDR